MTGLVLRAAGLTLVYLLVLTSVEPGDIAVGALLGLAVAWTLGPKRRRRGREPWPSSLRAAGAVAASTTAEMARGSWRVVRLCLGATAAPGFVEIPRDGRSRSGVAFWGVLTGEAPDEYPVDVDEERDVLLVHLVDASEPDDVRERHRRAYRRQQRRVVP